MSYRPAPAAPVPAPAVRATSVAETFSVLGANLGALATLTSGCETVQMLGSARPGLVVARICWRASGTAAASPTNQWFTLRDSSLTLLGVTADDTTNGWAANAEKELTLSTPVTLSGSGPWYIGCMVRATTVPTLMGAGISPNGIPLRTPSNPTLIAAVSNNGGTYTDPSAAAAQLTTFSNAAGQPYGWVR